MPRRAPEREPEPAKKPFLRFIYLQHGWLPEDPEFLLRQFDDVELIFLEVVGQSPESRQLLEQQFNLALADPAKLSPKKADWQLRTIEQLRQGRFMANLVVLLAGSGKQAKLIDISSQDPSYELYQKAKEEQATINQLLRQKKLAAAQQLLMDNSRHFGTLNRHREKLVREQIGRVCAARKAANRTVRAAVVQGLVHFPTASLFDPKKFQSETVFLPIPLPLVNQLEIKHRLGESADDDEYRRALLADFILPLTLNRFDANFFSDIEYFENLLDSLTAEQYGELIAELERLAGEAMVLRSIAVALLELAHTWSRENQSGR